MSSEAKHVQWTAENMPDVRGRHFVVTGGNGGLGYVTVQELAARGATVTLACRDVAKGKAARDVISAEVGPVEIDVRELDLASLESIRDFSAALATAPLDCLINNAGVMAPPLSRTKDGFELQFGTNHLGHFALTGHLWSALMKAQNPRVVTLASNAHKPGKIDFDNLDASKSYSAWGAYSQSKLANLLFAFELDRRAKKHGHVNFKSIAAHPGYSATNLSSSVAPQVGGAIRRFARKVELAIGQTAAMGALPQLYAATALEVPSAAYVGPDGWGEWRGYPRLVTPMPRARDEALAARLWTVSESLTGVAFL